MTQSRPGQQGPIIFVLSWERPLYLWSCLDGLYRNTRMPCRFVLIDNASTDPLVQQVIGAFENRGLFHRVHLRSSNSPEALAEALREHDAELGDYFGYIESDVLVPATRPSWLEQFQALTQADPTLAMVGSLVDKTDFVDPAWAARTFPDLKPEQLDFLIKCKSPERKLQDGYAEPLIDPFNPPGRLLFLKTEFIRSAGILRDRVMYEAAKRMGYNAGIATGVRHRHLSFQNLFDYPGTDIGNRNAFFKALEGKPAK
jgi:hypothetical protein